MKRDECGCGADKDARAKRCRRCYLWSAGWMKWALEAVDRNDAERARKKPQRKGISR